MKIKSLNAFLPNIYIMASHPNKNMLLLQWPPESFSWIFFIYAAASFPKHLLITQKKNQCLLCIKKLHPLQVLNCCTFSILFFSDAVIAALFSSFASEIRRSNFVSILTGTCFHPTICFSICTFLRYKDTCFSSITEKLTQIATQFTARFPFTAFCCCCRPS